LKGANVNWKAFQEPKWRNFGAIDRTVLIILLQNLKMAFALPERQLEIAASMKILQQDPKPVLAGQ
jgi:hypothetical protein